MPKLHIFMLTIILILFVMVVLESLLGLALSYFVTLIDGYWNSTPYNWYLFIMYSVFPIRDLFVASLFCYLYYSRGVKDQRGDVERLSTRAHEQMIKTIALTETG